MSKDNILKTRQQLFRSPLWMLIAAFGTYFCMYGFRKPYTAATYSNLVFFGIGYKFLLIIAQTTGYVLAKWLGIKIVSEIRPARRIRWLISLIVFAELMLLFFGIVPRPWNIFCLLLNGLSLGVVFGLVLGFLEGRKNTEALIAGLCASFIVSDGLSKSVGKLLLDYGVTENWMPFFAGIVFVVPTLIFIAMLSCVPAPSASDIQNRSARVPMSAKARWKFFLKYAPGLVCITLIYLLATLLRSVRADFAPELWRDLGYHQTPELFTQSELLVSFGVMLVNGLAIFIGSHYKAFRFALISSLAGFTVLLLSIYGLQYGLGKFPFMVFIGLGVYLPYVAVHTTIFERLIAITKERANIGFLMYLVDAVGYTGYILLMLLKYMLPSDYSILYLFIHAGIYFSVVGGLTVILCNWYFKMKLKNNERQITQQATGQSGGF